MQNTHQEEEYSGKVANHCCWPEYIFFHTPQPFHACWIRLVQPNLKSLKLSACKEVLIFQMSYSYLMNSLLELESDARMLEEDTDKI